MLFKKIDPFATLKYKPLSLRKRIERELRANQGACLKEIKAFIKKGEKEDRLIIDIFNNIAKCYKQYTDGVLNNMLLMCVADKINKEKHIVN